MTHWQLKQEVEARDRLQQANTAAESELKGLGPELWNRRLTLELFRREADEMIAAHSDNSARH
jgi:hypothetical protein